MDKKNRARIALVKILGFHPVIHFCCTLSDPKSRVCGWEKNGTLYLFYFVVISVVTVHSVLI